MSPAVPLAVYDFDGTVIKGDSIVAYLRFAHARGQISTAALLRAGAAHDPAQSAHLPQ